MSSVSVIIPTYNRASLLRQTVESVLPQLDRFDELIVVDDGSTDDTAAVVATYGQRVRYHWQKNAFLAGARNAGMKLAKSEFLMFVDSDDLLLESALNRLRWRLKQCLQSPLAFGTVEGFSSDGPVELDRLDDPSKTRESLRLVQRNFIRSPGCVLIRRSALSRVGLWDKKLRGIEDWDMWLRLSLLGPFAREELPVLRYRVHPANMSSNDEMMWRSRCRMILKHSSYFAVLRKDREAWAYCRAIRPFMLRDEFRFAARKYKRGEESLTGFLKSGAAYATSAYGLRSLATVLGQKLSRNT